MENYFSKMMDNLTDSAEVYLCAQSNYRDAAEERLWDDLTAAFVCGAIDAPDDPKLISVFRKAAFRADEWYAEMGDFSESSALTVARFTLKLRDIAAAIARRLEMDDWEAPELA